MAADLIAHATVVSAANRHAEPSHQGFVIVLCHVDKIKQQTVEIGVLSDQGLVEEAIKLAHQKRNVTKDAKAA
jgi:hypothetical protein